MARKQLPHSVPSTWLTSTPSTLGSPIWLYSPAPPIWAFVEHNRFDGQRVVLFNIFSSEFSEEQINAFRVKVMARGARSFEHRYVPRVRMTQ
ncbi:hypothetical protein N5E30_08265 [Pseudomonas chengduensis]|nr:hypothetical protein [Pseudomonas chengduensis]MDH1681571.1 hypothetical protein [Pseudomonas chengduensis]